MNQSAEARPELSVILPAYREQERIGRSLERLRGWLGANVASYEIIVVDDGSDDATVAIAQDHVELDPNVRVIRYQPNRGKGYAVRSGLREARGRYAFFTDVDLSTPPEELADGLRLLADADMVVGTRARPDSQIVVRQSRHREGMGRVFNALVQALGLTRMPDTQCGYKGFRAEVLPDLLANLSSDRFAFDVEMLSEAERQGLKLVEQPVQWVNDPRSRVRIFRDALGMFLELIAIAIRQRRRRRAGG